MGTRGIDVRSGWVADYCQICRDVEAHAVVLDDAARNQLDNPIVECAACKLQTRIPALRYLSVCPRRPASLAALLQHTFPRLPLEIEQRVRFEKNAIEGNLEAPDRLEAIREPFLLIPPISTSFGVFTLVQAVMAGGFMFVLLSGAASNVPGAAGTMLRLLAALVSLSAMGIFLWRRAGGFTRRDRLAMLARSLRPLRPTVQELESTLAWAKGMGLWMGSQFTARQVATAMKRRPDRSLTNVDELHLVEAATEMRERLAAAQQSFNGDSFDQNRWNAP